MELKDFFLKQFAYNDAMNLTMLHKLQELEHPPVEAVKLMSHISMVQVLWLQRLYGSSKITKSMLETLSIPEMEDKLKNNHQGWIDFVEEKDDDALNEKYTYQNIKGETFENYLYDVLFHVINHSTHHRAQISKILRQHEIEPPVTDYIAFVR